PEQGIDELAVVGIADLGPVQGDGGDAARIEAVDNGSAGHGKVSASLGRWGDGKGPPYLAVPAARVKEPTDCICEQKISFARAWTRPSTSSFGHICAASYRCGGGEGVQSEAAKASRRAYERRTGALPTPWSTRMHRWVEGGTRCG